VDWASWDYAARPQGTQPKFALKTILRGDHDAYIREWATQAKAWGHPFFLRFNWEMNGSWFPWSEVRNGNARGEFVKAWRHVHDIFREVGAKNVTWVWCTAVEYGGSQPLAELYPGNEYVDWVATDGFNWAGDRNTPWRSFREVFELTYKELVRLAPNKPVMIAEVASTENSDSGDPHMSKGYWIEDAFARMPEDFPHVKAVAWFNWNADNPSLSWPIESSAASVRAFKRAIASPYYVGNEFAELAKAPIEPPPQQVPVQE
jgi:beta-mannanase